jgi:hypothetical protein
MEKFTATELREITEALRHYTLYTADDIAKYDMLLSKMETVTRQAENKSLKP